MQNILPQQPNLVVNPKQLRTQCSHNNSNEEVKLCSPNLCETRVYRKKTWSYGENTRCQNWNDKFLRVAHLLEHTINDKSIKFPTRWNHARLRFPKNTMESKVAHEQRVEQNWKNGNIIFCNRAAKIAHRAASLICRKYMLPKNNTKQAIWNTLHKRRAISF